MGRRSASLADERRWVFNRVAADYRARPPWPGALADRLAELAGGPGARAADLGAGTGLLALPLAARGLEVTAVEPARAMLAAVAAAAAPRVRAVHATAEATGLPGGAFDLVVLADAVQWVDPELAGREAARLLAPGGALALVEAAFAATPFMAALAEALSGANPKARPRPEGAARQLMALAAPGAPPRAERFRQEAPLAPGALEAVVRSFTFAGPALGPAALDAVLTRLRAAAGDGPAAFARDVTVRWVRRPRRAA
jgi:SAM-dependent methyltransferase